MVEVSSAQALNDYQAFWRRFDCRQTSNSSGRQAFLQRAQGRRAYGHDSALGSFVESEHLFSRKSAKLIHTALLPQPHHGDIASARVIILLKNPGFHVSDYWAEENNNQFRQALVRSLRSERNNVEFPFLLLDPTFCWHGGFMWWEAKLRSVTRAVSDRILGVRYAGALSQVSKRVAAIEALPYHSESGFDDKWVRSLPSFELAKRLAHALAREGKLVIVARCEALWDVPPSENVIVYSRQQARGASLSLNSKGGMAILKACLLLIRCA